MKVLIIGGCGFIGSHTVNQCVNRGFSVAVVDNLSTGSFDKILQWKEKINFYHCSVLDDELENIFIEFRPDCVIHLAAQTSVSDSVRDPCYDATVNILGSLKVIELSNNFSVKKIVYSSTAAVYGNPVILPIDTDHSVDPLSPYGISKTTVEQYLRANKLLHGTGYTILRYANVYGPQQDVKGEGGVIAIFANEMTRGNRPKIYGDGKQTRDFIYVEDVASANIQALFHGNGETYNVCSGSRTSINRLFSLMAQFLSKSITPVYEKERQGEIKHSVLSPEKTKTDLFWVPKTSLEEGLRKTIDYYKRNKNK